jgi:hypothetical protein
LISKKDPSLKTQRSVAIHLLFAKYSMFSGVPWAFRHILKRGESYSELISECFKINGDKFSLAHVPEHFLEELIDFKSVSKQ